MEKPPNNKEKKAHDSEFGVVEETQYGPVLRKANEAAEQVPELPELNEQERKGLRGILSSLGVKLKPEAAESGSENKEGLTEEEHSDDSEEELGEDEEEPAPRLNRREFMGLAGGIIAAGALGPIIGSSLIGKDKREEELVSNAEELEKDLFFNAEIEGYKAFASLAKDEVLFLDENNIPVGEPQKIRDFVVKRKATPSTNPNHIHADGTVAYKLSPGEINEIGIPENGLAGEWLDYVQLLKQAENPNQKIKRRMSVVGSFLSAYKEKDEPELVSKIAEGEINRNIDIVKYFAHKPVRGAEELSRLEYVKNKIELRSEPDGKRNRPAVPEIVQNEIRRVLPGLFAQESKFNAGLVSKSDAAGLAQIKPDVWKEYKGTEDVSLSLIEQAEVVGELMSDNYHYILHFAGDEAIKVLRDKFDSEEEFYEDLMTPLIINAYNAGGPMIGKAVKDFVDNSIESDISSGKDLFLQIVNHTKENRREEFKSYANEAREYVPRVYAMAEVLDENVG